MSERTNPEAPGPESPAATATLEDLEALRNRLREVDRKQAEYLDLLQRARAEFENYQKRSQRDLAEERRHAHAPFARELLPALDNLQRALDAVPQEAASNPLIRGVTLVQSQLLDIFRRFGITPILAQGMPFDPMQHEAVLQQPRADVAPGVVVQVVEPGYRLRERILRPAKVVVSASPVP